jgi:hypothetical protein
MAPKAVSINASVAEPEVGSDLYLLAMPMTTMKLLTDVAAKRNMTFSQALSQALSDFVQQTDTEGPKLLTEAEKGG